MLGIVGGTAVGYGIQADREPTPLPALNQLGLGYPKPLPKGKQLEPLGSAEDKSVRTNGDLRKLLLPKPAGAKASGLPFGDGWMSVPEYASHFNSPRDALADQLGSKIRRVAAVSWKTGTYRSTEIRLVQFRPSDLHAAREHAEGQMDYLEDEDFAGNDGDPLAGSANGHFYLFPVHREAGYLDLYEARAIAYRGDITVEIFMYDTKKIAKKDIKSLAERQLGRL